MVQDIQLTKDQADGLEKLLTWIKQPLFNTTFSLTGRAGTGKTTLINTFLQQCGVSSSGIVTTAPTHKAKSVIARHTNRTSETIQKLLGLRLDCDVEKFDPEKPAFNQKAAPTINQYKLVVIDEASMINKALYELILSEAKMFNVKVLFLGDPRQLPPVGEEISYALKSEGSNHDLKEIIRQDNMNPIMLLLDSIVEDIEQNKSTFNALLKTSLVNVNHKEEGYIFTRNSKDFANMILKDFSSPEFARNYEHCKVVSWRNAKVNQWNGVIRNQLFQTDDPLVENDLIMSYKTVVDEFNAQRMINSVDYAVENVRKFTTEKGITGRIMDLREAETGNLTQKLFVVDKESFPTFVKLYNYYYNYSKSKGGAAWQTFFKWRNQHLVLTDVFDATYEEQYGEKLLVTGKDIDYGYSITVHKSQGSTYRNVYIDLRDIAANRNIKERRKLLYVALSRASGKAIIYF